MKKLLTLGWILAVPLIMGCWSLARAQSLGTPAADLWVGQPLQMTVPARFIEGEGGGECVHADVFYGDSRLQGDRVRATVVGPQDSRRVRIEADVPIDEPIVTVSLRAGCRNSVTRSYTLLPDIASETVLAAMARPQAPPLVTAAAPLPLRTSTAAAPAARAPAPRAERAVLKAETAMHRQADAAPKRVRTAARGASLLKTTALPTARLRLEPIDTDAHAFLRVTASLADPAGDASRRATAAMLWQAINADPQELLRTSAMLQKLEGDLAQLKQTAGATRSEMAALRRSIDNQQPWYASGATLQVLAVLVLAAAAAAGMLWWRTRNLVLAPPPWYERTAADPAPAAREAVAVVPQSVPATAQERAAEALAAVAVRTTPQPIPAFDSAAPAGVATGPRDDEAIDFELPRPVAVRAASGVLRVETLAATFEEAEFLSSLGLNADAMDVLRTYLQDSASAPPLAYFELMRLCDEVEDPQALATVRRRYAKVFGVPAPTLEQVTAAGGIETLPTLSARLTRAWGTPEALDLIEQALFSVPSEDAVLTVQAGRELLTLHDLGMSLAGEHGAGPQGASLAAEAHPMAPWAHADDPAMAEALAQAIADADGGHHFALDVDLDAAPEPLPEKQEEEELAPEIELELAPFISEMEAARQREAAREAAARAQAEAEDAFSAAVALERAPTSRY